MLDMNTLRRDTEAVKAALLRKGARVDVAKLLALDDRRRRAVREYETASAQRRRAPDDGPGATRDDVRVLRDSARQAETELRDALLAVPNLPRPGVPTQLSDEERVVRQGGATPSFEFEPRPHWDLGEQLGLWDDEAARRCAGPRYALLKSAGARLARALVNFMLDTHTRQFGFEEIAPPFIVRREALSHTGQMPSMASGMFPLNDDEHFLTPSGEAPLVSALADSVLDGAALPKRWAACCTCFRKEVGSAGRGARGLARLHQFDCVHLVSFCHPDRSEAELDHLVRSAETIPETLGLRYRIVRQTAAELSFAAAEALVLEAWAPGTKRWLTLSTIGNFTDFQARRANIRFRRKGETAFVHIANGAGTGLPRLMIALVETFQTGDGAIVISPRLRSYLNGLERIPPVESEGKQNS